MTDTESNSPAVFIFVTSPFAHKRISVLSQLAPNNLGAGRGGDEERNL